jgi:hypothetical protein
MSSQQRDCGQRRSFRSRIPPGQHEALLEVGRRCFAVRLLNESVEGAAVCADRDVAVKPDNVVRVWTTFGRFEARVVHVTRLGPFGTVECGENCRFRLGLEWLRELSTPPTVQAFAPATTRSPAPPPREDSDL